MLIHVSKMASVGIFVVIRFPERPAMRSFDIFFYLRLDKRLSKQSWGWWFDTPSRSLRRHCNVSVYFVRILQDLLTGTGQ